MIVVLICALLALAGWQLARGCLRLLEALVVFLFWPFRDRDP